MMIGASLIRGAKEAKIVRLQPDESAWEMR